MEELRRDLRAVYTSAGVKVCGGISLLLLSRSPLFQFSPFLSSPNLLSSPLPSSYLSFPSFFTFPLLSFFLSLPIYPFPSSLSSLLPSLPLIPLSSHFSFPFLSYFTSLLPPSLLPLTFSLLPSPPLLPPSLPPSLLLIPSSLLPSPSPSLPPSPPSFKNEKLLLLLTSTELLHEEFLTCVYEFVKEGAISPLFSREERSHIVNAIRSDLTQTGLAFSHEIAWKFFIE